jgi:phytol kinase
MALILTVLAVFVVLLVSELGWRKQWFDNEAGRKFVHILVGTFVATWPFFLSWTQIRLLSLAFLVVVIASSYLKLFHAINSVQRPTYGEVFFAATVGLLTFITHSKGVYAAALLQMRLADGFAAIVGTRFGRDNKYHVLGHTKSVAGTVAFLVTSLAILIGYGLWSMAGLAVPVAIYIALIAAVLENAAPLGLDNLLVPLVVGLLITRL